jgi:uncharacterized membrane protein
MNVSNRSPVISAGILLGCGLGAFVDGIVLHQMLQWHNMLSSVRPPVDLVSMKYNMLWDGAFHVFAWLVVVLGVWRLWRAGKRADVSWSTPTLLGAALLGWGLFNFIEGLIDHQLLGLHHVHPGSHQNGWDLAFLALGLIQIAVGGATMGIGSGDLRAPHSSD